MIGITGMSFLTGIGEFDQHVEEKIFAGEIKIEGCERFEKLGLNSKKASMVTSFEPKLFDKTSSFLRLPKAYQYAIYVVYKALIDAGVDMETNKPERIGVFYATGLAAISDVEKFYKPILSVGLEKGSPIHFPNTTSSVGCGLISIRFNIRGKNMVISSGGISGIQAVEIAVMSIQKGEIDIAVIVGSDELTETVYKAYYCANMLARDKKGCKEMTRPYASKNIFGYGTILGEGAAAIVIESAESALRRKQKFKGIIKGTACGNNLIKRGNLDGKGSCIVMDYALKRSGMPMIDAVIGSGNGNYILDKNETVLLKELNKKVGYELSVITPTLLFGETVGAGSILAIICGVLMIEKQRLIPIKTEEIYESDVKLNTIGEDKLLKNILVNGASFYGDAASLVLGNVNT